MAYRPSWSQRTAISIKKAIDRSDKSLNKLADETAIPLSTLFRRYRGANAWDTEQIEKVARALGLEPDDILPGGKAAA